MSVLVTFCTLYDRQEALMSKPDVAVENESSGGVTKKEIWSQIVDS